MLALLWSVLLFSAAKAESYLPPDAQIASARHCGAVDFRRNLPKARSQGDTGFCYAYSSATLIAQRTGVDVSATDLATSFYFSDPSLLRSHRDPLIAEYLNRHP